MHFRAVFLSKRMFSWYKFLSEKLFFSSERLPWGGEKCNLAGRCKFSGSPDSVKLCSRLRFKKKIRRAGA